MSMNIDNLTLGQIKELYAIMGGSLRPVAPLEHTSDHTSGHLPSPQIGRFVVIRTYSAGVHAGILVAKKGDEAILRDARRIWSWTQPDTNDGALSGVANHGVGPGSKVAGPCSIVELTGVIEVLACTEKAIASIEEAKWKA